jgi:hypothetical protein
MVVPVVDDIEWRFADLAEDPHEEGPVRSLTFKSFLKQVEDNYGIAAAEWAEAAAFMARWWVEDNWRRWRYDPVTTATARRRKKGPSWRAGKNWKGNKEKGKGSS